MRTFRLLDLAAHAPARNMALDDALLEAGDDTPVLRLSTWEPAGLSLGYFQTLDDVPSARAADTTVVRRFTGGGAIHHGAELTFAITAPASDPLYRGPVADSYCRVHKAVVRALAAFGVEARIGPGTAGVVSDRAGTGMCFHAVTSADIVWDAGAGPAKGVGSAQRRRGGRVLHHGSIKLDTDPLEPGVATVSAAAGRPVDARAMAKALLDAFVASFDAEFEPSALTDAELAHADRLGDFFADPRFLADRRARPAAR